MRNGGNTMSDGNMLHAASIEDACPSRTSRSCNLAICVLQTCLVRRASHRRPRLTVAPSLPFRYAPSLSPSRRYLEADGPMERTYKFKQGDIAAAAPQGAARRAVNLTLDTYGPYRAAYSRNGRYMLLGGEKGHVAVVDWLKLGVSTEFNVKETVRDVAFLHNSMLFAVAQKKYAYIYDHTGTEIHCLRHHVQPLALDFLPYHFLLASVGNAGILSYQDVSTGQLVAQHKTKTGACSVMRQNPWNAVEALGHGNGTVSMWTPNMNTPVVKMLTHRGPVTALAIDAGGRYMVTSGLDARLKVWDVRKFREEPLFNYFLPAPARTLDVSQRGNVAVGWGGHVQVWGRDFALENDSSAPLTAPVKLPRSDHGGYLKFPEAEEEGGAPLPLPPGVRKASAPYVKHDLPGSVVTSVRFRPFDDFLAVGHAKGLASVLVPGAGEPNFDSGEADPFMTSKGRREAEVASLLDKLPPTSITLDPTDVGGVDRASAAVREKERKSDEAAVASAAAEKARSRPMAELGTRKAKSQAVKRAGRKAHNVITSQRAAASEKSAAAKEAQRDAQKAAAAAAAETEALGGAGGGGGKSALSRFYGK